MYTHSLANNKATLANSYPHWFSVDDALPPKETDDEFIQHSVEVLGYYDGLIDRMFYDYDDEMWFDGDFCHKNPSHWMLLPEPPKKGE